MEPSPEIEPEALERLQQAASGDETQIIQLIQYRREVAAVAYQTGYKAHRQLFKDASRRLKKLLAL